MVPTWSSTGGVIAANGRFVAPPTSGNVVITAEYEDNGITKTAQFNVNVIVDSEES